MRRAAILDGGARRGQIRTVFPTHYQIRHLRIEPNLVLAPMEGVTDLTFRRLVRSIGGVGLTVTEFVASEALRRGVEKAELMARFDPDEHPVAVQIYGRVPEAMAEAARVIEAAGADIVDLNFGCPSKKVCAHSGGSSLLREPDLARQIVRSVRAAITIPLTVKMRSGFDAGHRNAPDIAAMCEDEGVEAITIHWRTRADLYAGTRAVDKIAEAKRRVRIPVVGNGDVVDAASARAMLHDTGVDGVMIGRGAIKNPWVFQQVRADLLGLPPVTVDAQEKRRVLLAYFEAIRGEFRNDRGTLGRMKKIANYFTHGLPYGSDLRVAFLHSQSIDEAVGHTERFFDALAAREETRLVG
ncbi:MAG: tRNA dihydrouridine synthase DusB [Deltaproteobacteria bacterium]|nr:tRNA dihydrouridine synthase DusB [Deltaproteobacteria bacterium]